MGGSYGGTYAGPKEVQYLFIDGEQLRRTAEEVGKDWFGAPVDIDYRALQGTCQKVFYYDCLPAKPSGADEGAYRLKYDNKIAFFNQLRAIPGWHVSEGLARHRKKERQEQKEVDILIAVDMLTHTHRKNMHRLTFVSGDQDFAPLLEAVVRDGMYVELLYPEGHTSQDLMHFADVAKPMDIDFLHAVSTQTYKRHFSLPSRSGEGPDGPPDGVWVGEGMLGGQSFAKVWRGLSTKLFTIKMTNISESNGTYWVVRDWDEARAKRYFNLWLERDFGFELGPLVWEPRPE